MAVLSNVRDQVLQSGNEDGWAIGFVEDLGLVTIALGPDSRKVSSLTKSQLRFCSNLRFLSKLRFTKGISAETKISAKF